MVNLIQEVKSKKEFAGLPDNLVSKVLDELEEKLDDKTKVKETRAKLRKYFGVFLTNKVMKPKDIGDYNAILKSHKSSAKRDYSNFYQKLFNAKDFETVIDLGCGTNGFSYPFLSEANSKIKYIGVEASKVLVDNMNRFFEKGKYDASATWLNLLEMERVKEIFDNNTGRKCVFCFQVIDALERLEENYGSKLLHSLLKWMSKEDLLIVSFPMSNLSGRRELAAKRNWIIDFLKGKAKVKEISMYEEKFLIIETL